MANLGLQRGDLQRGKQFAQAPQCWLTDMALYYGDSCKMQWHFTTTAIKNSSDESQWSPWVSGTGTLRGDAGALEGPLLLPQHHDVTGRGSEGQKCFASKQNKLVCIMEGEVWLYRATLSCGVQENKPHCPMRGDLDQLHQRETVTL